MRIVLWRLERPSKMMGQSSTRLGEETYCPGAYRAVVFLFTKRSTQALGNFRCSRGRAQAGENEGTAWSMGECKRELGQATEGFSRLYPPAAVALTTGI